jgi:hypothetical protein
MDGCPLFCLFAKNWSHGILGLLQHYPPATDIDRCGRHVSNVPITDIASLDNRLKSEDESAFELDLFRQLRRQEFADFQN